MWRTCLKQRTQLNNFIIQSNVNHCIKTRLCLVLNNNNFNSFRCLSSKLDEKNKIYSGPLAPQIKAVKLFSLGSSVAGLFAQPIILAKSEAIGSTTLLVAICSVVGFFTFVTPLLLHLITKKYVLYIHYNPEDSTYTATTFNFFLMRKQVTFTPGDVEVPDVPGMFSTFNVKGKPLFVEARHFSDPTHYVKLMGYDKPMDFKLGNEEKENESIK